MEALGHGKQTVLLSHCSESEANELFNHVLGAVAEFAIILAPADSHPTVRDAIASARRVTVEEVKAGSVVYCHRISAIMIALCHRFSSR